MFSVLACVLVMSMVAVIQWSLSRGMVEYVNQKELEALKPVKASLIANYQDNNNWLFIKGDVRQFDRLLRQSLAETEFSIPHRPPKLHDRMIDRRRSPEFNRRNHRPVSSKSSESENIPNARHSKELKAGSRQPRVSYALLNENKQLVVGHFPVHREFSYIPLKSGSDVIGYFAVSKRTRMLQGYELDFVEQQRHYLWYLAAIMLLFIFVVTIPLAKHFIDPIKKLAVGMHALTMGDYSKKLTIERKDEFAQLARDYNELALSLSKSEGARKRWLANTSHELRTPVAVLKGELEAIMDGVRPLAIEQIESAHQEVQHLQHLIEDLHALTSADIGGMKYRKSPLNVTDFINEQAKKLQNYLANANLMLIYQGDDQLCAVYGDETRLSQLFENLANNCIKYGHSANTVKLSWNVDKNERQIHICLEDNGVGVEEQHLAHLFEHLYRVENSRNKATGGSGLGLAICAHIVTAHEGQIYAKNAELGGLAVHIVLPTINPNLLENKDE